MGVFVFKALQTRAEDVHPIAVDDQVFVAAQVVGDILYMIRIEWATPPAQRVCRCAGQHVNRRLATWWLHRLSNLKK